MFSIVVAVTLMAASDSKPSADTAAANEWVSLLDAKNWAESWSEAGSMFRSKMPEPNWVSTIQPLRAPLGAVSSRSVKSISKATSLPGAPAGDYEIVQFQTSFANKTDATETVVLAHEPSGWKVDGYFIR